MLIKEVTGRSIGGAYLTEQLLRENTMLCENFLRAAKRARLTPEQVYRLFEVGAAAQVQPQAQPADPQAQQVAAEIIKVDHSVDQLKAQAEAAVQGGGGPVENFDKKFDGWMAQLGSWLPASVVKPIRALQAWAKEDPVREVPVMLVMGILISFGGAQLSFGFLAIAGFLGLATFIMKLLLGSKFSQAAKAGAVSATIGAVLGGAVHGIEHAATAGAGHEAIKHAGAVGGELAKAGAEQLAHGGVEASIEGELGHFAQGVIGSVAAVGGAAASGIAPGVAPNAAGAAWNKGKAVGKAATNAVNTAIDNLPMPAPSKPKVKPAAIPPGPGR